MVHITQSTRTIKGQEIQRQWHLIDVKGKVLGREIPRITELLQGKHKRTYVPHLDIGDHVVIINAAAIEVTGKKDKQKEYDRYSGYQSGRKVFTYEEVMKKDPEQIIRHAVSGMLPKNKHRDPRLARLHVFVGADHTYSNEIQQSSSQVHSSNT